MLSEAKHLRLLDRNLKEIPRSFASLRMTVVSLVLGIRSFRLQPDGMPCVKAARWAVNGLPARRPFAGVMIVWGRVEPKPGNNCEGVTVARVDGDPFARTARAVAAKLS